MSIWFKEYVLEDLNKRSQGTMAEFLGIVFTEINEDSLVAVMPVTEKVKQPLGLVHGGANVVLAETIASTAANMVVDSSCYYCVGLEINTNHIRAVREGFVRAVARPIHVGKSTQVWQIDLFNQDAKQTASSRMTASVIAR